jgi:hypothetical protein
MHATKVCYFSTDGFLVFTDVQVELEINLSKSLSTKYFLRSQGNLGVHDKNSLL